MSRALVAVVLVLLFMLARPAERMLRAEAPPAPASQRIGAGRLLGSVLTGPFRPMLLTYLWIRGDILYGQGRYDELHQLYRVILSLYPNNERAREFLGWYLAFNLKSEAPTDALGWRWAEEGLDILVETGPGRSTVADWIRKQCGQNSVYLQRYAGPEWERERLWRAGLRRWGERHFGEALDRFELGLKVLEGREGFFYDRARRTTLLESLAYEELLRHGRSAHAGAAVAALKELGRETSDHPDLGPFFFQRAYVLNEVAAGRVPRRAGEDSLYAIAVAHWGLGAHAADVDHLRAAQRLLRTLGAEVYAEELDLVGRWIAHVQDPGSARPPLPFDGMP
ncbi:MAG: hypothetical protein ACYTEZ_03485 [Planctomycetota bacterium]